MSEVSKSVLITGCSSGIGAETARHLSEKGWTVYATARKPETLEPLAAAGCKTLALDVTDEASMAAAVAEVEAAEGAVGVLINNAGYSQSGAVETVKIDRVRHQFETNVFGLMRMCQLVLPGMRRQGWGKIVNVSSMGGKLVFPGGGVYHATKHAVEALSDALRWEVKEFGVDVIIIEPGAIRTGFEDKANEAMTEVESVDAADGDPYAEFNASISGAMDAAYHGPLGKLGGGPDAVAKAIEKSIRGRRSPTRVPVTASARLALLQRKVTPDGVWDMFMGTTFKRPGK